MSAKVRVSIERQGTRSAFVEFEDDRTAEEVYLETVQALRKNKQRGERKVNHQLRGKPGVSGAGLVK